MRVPQHSQACGHAVNVVSLSQQGTNQDLDQLPEARPTTTPHKDEHEWQFLGEANADCACDECSG